MKWWNRPNWPAYLLALFGMTLFFSGFAIAHWMPRTGFLITIAGFAVGVGHFLGHLAPRTVPKPPVYRQVIARSPSGLDGETVHLDCGHTVRLVYNRRDSIPCPDCAEALKHG